MTLPPSSPSRNVVSVPTNLIVQAKKTTPNPAGLMFYREMLVFLVFLRH